jgi:outer membrane protein OmpA-like peptidoglycan-associated protein
MKLTRNSFLVFGLALAMVAATGCAKRPGYVTNIPGGKTGVGDMPPGAPIEPQDKSKPGGEGIASADPSQWANAIRNREILKSYTAYFDFDSSVVKSSEKSKVAAVADYLKAHAADGVSVEGYCDERGTEEYNRSLGERRALALREELVSDGISPSHVLTESFGKDRPAETGHDESACSKNRRGEFILLTLPK